MTSPTSTTSTNPAPAEKMFTDKELQAIGAAVWAALEEDTYTLHERFFPNEQDNPPITKDELVDMLFSVSRKLGNLGVAMY